MQVVEFYSLRQTCDEDFMLKKSLSQNLIKDKKILAKMVQSGDVTKDNIVVEIGAGHGDLTRAICKAAGRVYSIELDSSFRCYLEPLEEEHKNLTIIFDDVLEVPFARFGSEGNSSIIGSCHVSALPIKYHLA